MRNFSPVGLELPLLGHELVDSAALLDHHSLRFHLVDSCVLADLQDTVMLPEHFAEDGTRVGPVRLRRRQILKLSFPMTGSGGCHARFGSHDSGVRILMARAFNNSMLGDTSVDWEPLAAQSISVRPAIDVRSSDEKLVVVLVL